MAELMVTRLSLQFLTGYNNDGEPEFKAKHYRNVSVAADSEALYEAALALSSLQKHDLDKVERNNTYELGL